MKKGFTLIELLVVVLIIGILAAVALPQYTKAVEKTRATEAKTLLNNLVTAEQSYYLANGTYTVDLSALDIQLPGVGSASTSEISTKNFNLSMVAAIMMDGSVPNFSAVASRITSSGFNTTGDLAYSLSVSMGEDGQVGRSCIGSESTCKSICNGRICNGDTTEWCYAGSGKGPIRDTDMSVEM